MYYYIIFYIEINNIIYKPLFLKTNIQISISYHTNIPKQQPTTPLLHKKPQGVVCVLGKRKV